MRAQAAGGVVEMGKRTVEKASAGCEKGLFADAQSLKQSSLRCGTRFVGAAEEPRQVAGSSPFGNARSLRQSSARCGTRFVGAAEGAWSGRMRRLAALCIAAVLVFSLSGLGGCASEQSFPRRQAMLLQRLTRSLPPLKTLPQLLTFRLLIWTIRSATWTQATMRRPPRASRFQGRPQVLTARVPQSMVRR